MLFTGIQNDIGLLIVFMYALVLKLFVDFIYYNLLFIKIILKSEKAWLGSLVIFSHLQINGI